MGELLIQYPWLPIVMPIFGVALGVARHRGWVKGFGLLGIAAGAAAAGLGLLGLLEGWGLPEWRSAPGVLFLLLGQSNVAGSTFSTLLERFGVRRANG